MAKQMMLNESLKQKKMIDFPGAKQQEEANNKMAKAHELRNDRAALKSVRREEDANKKALLEREKENFTKIYALKCYNGWLKICDNSAMIVAKWLELENWVD